MKKMSGYKFKTQLYIYFCCITALIILTIMGSLYLILKNFFYEQQIQVLDNQARQIITNVDNTIAYYNSYLELLAKDPYLKEVLEEGDEERIQEEFYRITKEFYEFNLGKIYEISIVNKGQKEKDGQGNYRQQIEVNGTSLNNRNEKIFSLYKDIAVPNINRSYRIEIKIYETEIFGLFSKDKSDNHIIITQKDDYIISASERKLFYNAIKQRKPVRKEDLNHMVKPIEIQAENMLGWKVTIYTDSSYLEKGYFKMLKTLLPVLFVVLILVIFMVSYITKRLNQRMKYLQEKIASIGSQDFYKNIQMEGEDEFTVLSDEVDNARVEIYKLLEENREINRKQSISNMIALRAQISSHFLFNSLASIKWLARQDNSGKQISSAIDELAVFLRYSIAIDENLVLVRREVEQLQAYIYLQKLRSGDDLNVALDIEDEILDCKTVKLILQPIVENAFFHARKGDGITLNVMIYSYSDKDDYYLVIEDDGKGIEKERIEEIFIETEINGDSKDGGYGIRNVMNRIAICTGGNGALTVESEAGKYTKITIRQKV